MISFGHLTTEIDLPINAWQVKVISDVKDLTVDRLPEPVNIVY